MEQEEKLCGSRMGIILDRLWSRKKSYVEAGWEFTYVGDKVSVGGGCEAAVTART